VHYHAEPGRRERLHAAIEAGAVPPSIAIDDCAAVLFEHETPVRCLSWADGAGAYRVALRDGRAVEVAMDCEALGRPHG
jgi:dipeptidase E